MARLSDSTQVQGWLGQITSTQDRSDVARIVDAMTMVGHDAFFGGLRERVLERARAASGIVGLYAEREIRKWKGVPNRLFKEAKRGGRVRAFGGGPQPVLPTRTYNPEVGSEGLLAWFATELCRERPDSFTSHPGPDEIRDKGVGTFLLLTDFIGSGGHAVDYLTAAWRIASVKSWRSGGLLRFETIAYSGLDAGRARVEAHPTSPRVTMVVPCASLDTAFPPANAARMKALCATYDPVADDPDGSLGFAGGGALIAFAHGCPNNAPRLLHTGRRGRWRPLFPRRVTSGLRGRFVGRDAFANVVERLQELGRGDLAQAPGLARLTEEGLATVLLLVAMLRGPRQHEALARRTGLTLVQVERLLAVAIHNGWVTATGHVTDEGRAHVSHVGAPAPRTYGVLPSGPETPYMPGSLRAP